MDRKTMTTIAALISVPLPDAVSPPAWESRDYTTANSMTPHDLREQETRAGTRNSTPVTIVVKAVLLFRRE
jgi:hypothetical protein